MTDQGLRSTQESERVVELLAALEAVERDARWLVGQWQRLRDEPVREVALAIVECCEKARSGS